jgi:ribonuclease HII
MAAVVLRGSAPDGVTDSKLLSPKKRVLLSRHIKAAAAGIGFGWVPAAEIDQIGLAAALRVAARRAIAAIGCQYDVVIIDGSINLLPEHGAITLPKADLHIPEVAAASIVAKVARDSYMSRLARTDARFGFERHVGYGTALHASMLRKYGPSLQHRRCFRPVQEACNVHG